MNQARGGQAKSNKERLFGILNKGFSENELRDICAQLEINYDTIPGATKADKLKLLVNYLDQQPHKIPVLVNIIKQTGAKLCQTGTALPHQQPHLPILSHLQQTHLPHHHRLNQTHNQKIRYLPHHLKNQNPTFHLTQGRHTSNSVSPLAWGFCLCCYFWG